MIHSKPFLITTGLFVISTAQLMAAFCPTGTTQFFTNSAEASQYNCAGTQGDAPWLSCGKKCGPGETCTVYKDPYKNVALITCT